MKNYYHPGGVITVDVQNILDKTGLSWRRIGVYRCHRDGDRVNVLLQDGNKYLVSQDGSILDKS